MPEGDTTKPMVVPGTLMLCPFLMGSNGLGSKLVKQVTNDAIIHTIWSIWIDRNNRYFTDKQCSMSTLFNGILAEVHLSFELAIVKRSSAIYARFQNF